MSERSKTPEILTPIPIPQTSDRDLQRVIDQWADQFGPTPVQFKSLRSDIDEWGLPWFRSGALVRKDGKILMMHESRIQIRNLKDAQLRQSTSPMLFLGPIATAQRALPRSAGSR